MIIFLSYGLCSKIYVWKKKHIVKTFKGKLSEKNARIKFFDQHKNLLKYIVMHVKYFLSIKNLIATYQELNSYLILRNYIWTW